MVKEIEEISTVLSELGTLYNAWSLNEVESLSGPIEKVGEAVDSTCTSMNQLAHSLEENVTEFLQEYTGFAKYIEKLLKMRHRKHAEYEGYLDSIETKQEYLQRLESSENESQRISAVLTAEGQTRSEVPISPTSRSSSGILATLNSFIDNDPSQTRRNNISKTKHNIQQLQDQASRALEELKQFNKELQDSLDEFQGVKLHDFKRIFVQFAKHQREYHEACLEQWKVAKQEVEKIPV
jgi:hypothetical protein